MAKYISILFFILIILLQGCAATHPGKKPEPVTLILENGDKIKCYVTHIGKEEVVFQALNKQKAYQYGDIIARSKIKEVKLADGSRLSLPEYIEYRKSDKKPVPKELTLLEEELKDPRYEELKKMKIRDMTDNEFRYFMAMKEREAQLRLRQAEEQEREKRRNEQLEKLSERLAQLEYEKKVTDSAPRSVEVLEFTKQPSPESGVAAKNYQEILPLIMDSGLAGSLLRAAQEKKQKGEVLTEGQLQLVNLIENSSQWQERKEQLLYLSGLAEKALYRVYLHNPQELKEKLELAFNSDEEMNFKGLMEQLHRRFGTNLAIGDFRVLLDVLGEAAAGAIKEILANYPDWQFIVESNKTVAGKR